MFPSAVTVAPKVSVDAYHNVTFGTASTVSCRYQELIETVLDSNGSEVISSAWLQFPASTSLDYNSRITLPDNSTPKIISINRIKDHLGRESCVEVYLAHSGGSL